MSGFRIPVSALFLAALLLAFSSSVSAASKVGFVEVAKVLREAPQVADVRAKLKKEFARRDNELIAMIKQLQSLQEKLKRDGAIMSAAERRRLEKDIIARQRRVKNAQSEFKEDLAIRQNEELGKLRRVIAEVIVQIAKEEKFDLVLENGVVYTSPQSNLTDKVLTALKSQHKK